MDLKTVFVSCKHLVKWFCERERCQRLRSSPEKAREGRERNLFWLISRLQAPTGGEVSGLSWGVRFYAPIPRSFPTGNFLSPLALRVSAKTLVSSRGGGRSAMGTSEHSTAPRSSPAGQDGYTGGGAVL